MCIEPFLVGWDHCSLHPFESPLFRMSFAARLPVTVTQVALANVEDKDHESSCFVKGSGCAALPLCSCRYGMFEIIKFFCYRIIMHFGPEKTCDVDLGALGLESLSRSMNLQFLSFILAPGSLEPHFMEGNLRVHSGIVQA